MTKNSALWSGLFLGILLLAALAAGCGQHAEPAPGVTPPAVVAPPAPMTYKPGMMEKRRALSPSDKH